MSKKNIAVVTGATGGLGKEFVKLLVQEKEVDQVWAIARNSLRLAGLREEFGEKIIPFSVDLSNREKICAFSGKFTAEDVNIKYLVNNAGYAKFGGYADLSVAQSLDMIDVNAAAPVALCLVCVPFMEEGGKIINIASQASFQPLPYLNIYAATKAFLRSYTRALNRELKSQGITATAVCPGWIDTGLFKRGETGAKKAPSKFLFMTSADKVAAKALEDAKKGKDMSVYSAVVKAQHAAAKILPHSAVMKVWEIMQGF